MRLKNLVDRMEEIAMVQPAIHQIVPDNIYALNNLPDAKFGVFGWTQDSHTEDMLTGWMRYSFILFYVDRLEHNDRNRLEIQSDGIAILSNIIRTLREEGAEADSVSYTTFNQRFTQECAGVMARVTFEVQGDSLCEEEY